MIYTVFVDVALTRSSLYSLMVGLETLVQAMAHAIYITNTLIIVTLVIPFKHL